MEEWRFIRDSKFYQVSNLGRIKRLSGSIYRKDNKPYSLNECILKGYITKCGYALLELKLDINDHVCIHRCVLEAFSPVNDMQELQVNHINGCKHDNRLENLEWTTRSENMQHAMSLSLFTPWKRCGEIHPLCKLKSSDVENIRKLIEEKKYTQHYIAELYGVSDTTICNIKKHKTRRVS